MIKTKIETSLQEKAISKIKAVLDDIKNDTHTISRPFAVGLVDKELTIHATLNRIEYGSRFIYMTPHSIKHTFRDSKPDFVKVSVIDLLYFVKGYHRMSIYFDNKMRNYIYSDN